MATNAENIQTRIAAIYAELAAGSSSKPDYSIGGRSVSWTAYRLSLLEELKMLNELVAAADGPWEIETIGR